MRVTAEEFRALDLEVHSFLAAVPLYDVSAIDLPGGGPDRTIADIRLLLSTDGIMTASSPVRLLFSLRSLIGRTLRWDGEAHYHPEESYLQHLTDDQRARSLVEPGTAEGPFQIMYVFPREVLSEIRNATVHAFSCMALWPAASGYRFHWAVYVRPVSLVTPFYMCLIDPFRRFVVYPTILRRLRSSWLTAYVRNPESVTA
jgi:hypothetical protein